MRLRPKGKAGKVQFCKARVPMWIEHAAELGLPMDQLTELAELTVAAEAAMTHQRWARQAAEAATTAMNQAVAKMDEMAGAMTRLIRAKSGQAGSYPKTLVPPRAKRSPVGQPGTPTGFKAVLGGLGVLELSWACRNPRDSQGTMYELWRRVDGGKMVFLGQSGTKAFIDNTVPPGTANLVYRIRAVRSTCDGDWAEFPVAMGTPANLPKAMYRTAKRQFVRAA